ncbi:MAG: serine--tRNA ligase [Caldiserica bacterium]|jgi:seryl-tRNA synthetase|nr:serine--tRNA ligase [Caldisericota bacterium]MDH7563033.1 serine--tRNA ligase [Caldisericota bacterium]
MIDLKLIRQDPEKVKESLRKRGRETSIVDEILRLDAEWRNLVSEQGKFQAELNRRSEEIGELKRKGEDVSQLVAEVRDLSDKVKELNAPLKEKRDQITRLLEKIPNLLHPSVPIGEGERDNRQVRKGGVLRNFDFTPLPHWEIASKLKLIDFERGTKISGSGFILYRGWGARLERALISWMLDLHREKHGYTELWPPYVINREAAYGTGKLPDFDDQMYRFENAEYYLNPTAEVPVTAIHAEEILSEEDLPIYYVAYTACFRREAGAAGKDTRGLLRVHQFDKVELVKLTRPQDSFEELEKMLKDAEEVVNGLGLPYEIVELCSMEVGFTAAKAYDINVFSPGTGKWLEVSSCSNCTDFQSRRLNIRFRDKETGKLEFVHTLNGSGIALARTVASILENYQEKDGSIKVPEVLKPYLGVDKIE